MQFPNLGDGRPFANGRHRPFVAITEAVQPFRADRGEDVGSRDTPLLHRGGAEHRYIAAVLFEPGYVADRELAPAPLDAQASIDLDPATLASSHIEGDGESVRLDSGCPDEGLRL